MCVCVEGGVGAWGREGSAPCLFSNDSYIPPFYCCSQDSAEGRHVEAPQGRRVQGKQDVPLQQ